MDALIQGGSRESDFSFGSAGQPSSHVESK